MYEENVAINVEMDNEDVIVNDGERNIEQINQDILQIEKKLKNTFTDEQLHIFLEYESLICEYETLLPKYCPNNL